MNELELKEIIANNIIIYRKALGLTQAELADKLNYSDKAISKWERAESVPDIYILKQLSDIFNISIDDLITPQQPQKIKAGWLHRRKKIIIPILSALLAWLIATIIFVFLNIFAPQFIGHSWLCFMYAIPASLIILIVFSAMWGNRIITAAFVSMLAWSIPLCVFLSFFSISLLWLFAIGVPLQIIIVLWVLLKARPEK